MSRKTRIKTLPVCAATWGDRTRWRVKKGNFQFSPGAGGAAASDKLLGVFCAIAGDYCRWNRQRGLLYAAGRSRIARGNLRHESRSRRLHCEYHTLAHYTRRHVRIIQWCRGAAFLVTPTAAPSSPTYSLNFPAGFVTGGIYNISAAGGSAIGPFQESITVDSPIRITNTQIPADISSGQPITVAWSGGASTSTVKVSLVYKSALGDYTAFGYTPSTTGSFTFQPICFGHSVSSGGNGVICGFGIPGLTEVVVDQMPATGQVSTFPAPGITSDVQATWDYRYVFGTNPQ